MSGIGHVQGFASVNIFDGLLFLLSTLNIKNSNCSDLVKRKWGRN